MSRLKRIIALWRSRRAAAAVEFAIIAPVAILAMLSVYDLGMALQQQIRLTDAVRAGGLYAASWPDPLEPIGNRVTASLAPWTDVDVPVPVMSCYCWDPTAQTSVSVPCPSTGTDTCTGGLIFQRFITVTASRPLSPVLLTNMTTTTAQYVARIK